MKTLLHHAHVLVMDENNTEFPCGYLLTQDREILEVGPIPEDGQLPEADRRIDCEGGLLLPGFVNLHAHASMVPFRSMGDDCPDRLNRFLFPLERDALTPELVRLGAMYGICEMLLSGTTTFVDMYYFEDQVAQACLDTGIRGFLGETVISQCAPDSHEPDGGLKHCEALIRKYARHDRVRPIVAPHGTTTVSESALRSCHALAAEYGTFMTLHVSEMDNEMRHFAQKGLTPVRYLEQLGVLDNRLLAAHCIHLTEEDMEILAGHHARVAHCPGSNAKSGKGICPVRDLEKSEVPFGFGTDGPSSGNTLSIYDQMRLFPLLQKTRYHDRSLFPAREIVRAATFGGARCLHMEDQIGRLLPHMRADLQVVSLRSIHMFPVYNPYSVLVYSANASDVTHVMADGRLLVHNGQLTQIDLSSLRQDLAEAMQPFYTAAEAYRAII